jgi:hypothetical protein
MTKHDNTITVYRCRCGHTPLTLGDALDHRLACRLHMPGASMRRRAYVLNAVVRWAHVSLNGHERTNP